jgi:Holliday junction resolvase RusA-like endonuclease
VSNPYAGRPTAELKAMLESPLVGTVQREKIRAAITEPVARAPEPTGGALLFRVDPIGKPRSTRFTDRQAPALVRWREYRDELRRQATAHGFDPQPEGMYLCFYLPMPPSWTKKKRAHMAGRPHTQKPDIDNLCKAFLDALMEDDAGVWALSAEKRWAERGAVVVTVER